jgi:hypothetical protein
VAVADGTAPTKKPRFSLARRKSKEADVTAVPTDPGATAADRTESPSPATVLATEGPEEGQTATAEPPAPSSRFSLRRRKAVAEGGLAGAAAAEAAVPPTAPPSNPVPLAVQLPPPAAPAAAAPAAGVPPMAPPANPVPLDVQLPPPGPVPPGSGAAQHPIPPGTPIPPTGDSPGGPSGSDGSSEVVLAASGAKSGRTALVVLVVLLVLVVLGGVGYLVAKPNSTATPTPAAPNPAAPNPAADTATAGAINLRLSDLPAGWTVVPPAQAVVRPPVAPATAQIAAANTMAACLGTSAAVVSGLFGPGSLPDQTSLVASPTYQSAAGSSFEMASRTAMLSSAGEVQALDNVFTDPKFDLCYQQYEGALAAAAVPGATVQVQPVTLGGPTTVQSYGVVSTYTLPGVGTEVVGDAYMLGGRVISELQPSTNGPSIPGPVFAPVFHSVVGRVAAATR